MLVYSMANVVGTLRRAQKWNQLVVHGSTDTKTVYKTVQVQVVHRHGDRTPITPMKNVEFWQSQLLPPEQLEKIALNTKILRDENSAFSHSAGGEGVFGKLTELGLLQMIKVGLSLREEFAQGNGLCYSPLFDTSTVCAKEKVRVFSTDFPRTVCVSMHLFTSCSPKPGITFDFLTSWVPLSFHTQDPVRPGSPPWSL